MLQHLVVPRCALAVVVVLFAGLAPASALAKHHPNRHATSHRRTRACKRGRFRARVGKRSRCVRQPAPRLVPSSQQWPVAQLRASLAGVPGLNAKRVLASRAFAALRQAAAAHALPVVSASRLHARAAQHVESDLPNGFHADVTIGKGGGEMTVRHGATFMTLGFEFPYEVARCPAADGSIPGSARYKLTFNFDIPRVKGAGPIARFPDGQTEEVGQRAFMFLTEKADTDATGHGTDDAHLRDFDVKYQYFVHVQVGIRSAKGDVLRTNRPTIVRGDAAESGLHAPIDIKDRSGLASILRGAHVSNVVVSDGAWDAGPQHLAERLWGFFLAHAALLGDEYLEQQDQHWQVDCLHVALAADKDQLHPNETATIHATVTPALGGAQAPPRMTASATGGVVTPDAAPEGTTEMPFAFAALSDFTGGSVTVRAVSRQGVGTATVGLAAAPPEPDGYQYRVTMHATGSYTEDDSQVDDGSTLTRHMDDGIQAIDATWDTAYLSGKVAPLVTTMGAQAFTVSGTNTTKGHYEITNGVDDYTCTAPIVGALGINPVDPSQQARLIAAPAPSGGAMQLTLQPFRDLLADDPSAGCTRNHSDGTDFFNPPEAVFAGYGLPDIRDLHGNEAPLTLSAAQLGQPSFTVTVPSAAFPTTCASTPQSGGGTTYGCSHTLTWTATLAFTRLSSCTDDGTGGWRCRPD
ncbi:MAG TPA: hypothetical protein VFT50_03320 [Baekduia sp.]|nr:hypothetical protein [Baekduia sp.]